MYINKQRCRLTVIIYHNRLYRAQQIIIMLAERCAIVYLQTKTLFVLPVCEPECSAAVSDDGLKAKKDSRVYTAIRIQEAIFKTCSDK